jgi:hypothetical protein
MQAPENRLAYVGHRAYELARSGDFENFASIQQEIIDEGYAESVPWLEWPGVIEAIDQICHVSRGAAMRGGAMQA